MKRQKYIVWAIDVEQGKVIIDIIVATTGDNAEKRLHRDRPYPLSGITNSLLSAYVEYLQKELTKV